MIEDVVIKADVVVNANDNDGSCKIFIILAVINNSNILRRLDPRPELDLDVDELG
jgi:hypothetical protein